MSSDSILPTVVRGTPDTLQRSFSSAMVDLKRAMDASTAQTFLTVATLVLLLAGLLTWLLYYAPLASRECSTMTAVYGTLNGKLSSIRSEDAEFKYTLKDYYVKTAYNCCSGGSYVNDYVDTCVLKALLKQGVRCLDFEVYSIDDQPVVATSVTDNFHVKQTFNSVPFSAVMAIVADYAFSGASAPNPADPLLLHFRFKSSNVAMYDNLAKIFEGRDSLFLGKEYSYENHGENLGNAPLASLMGRVVVIADKSNPAFMESQRFYEYVNMTSNSPYMRAMRYYDIKFAPDINELIESNKFGMTLAMPDAGASPANPDPVVLRETGCQFLGMRYQLIDVQSETADIFFDENGHAFVLKPEKLRYVPVELPAPPPQDPALSYATRTVQSDYYKFEI